MRCSSMSPPQRCQRSRFLYGCLGCSAECGRCARTIKTIITEARHLCAGMLHASNPEIVAISKSGCPAGAACRRTHFVCGSFARQRDLAKAADGFWHGCLCLRPFLSPPIGAFIDPRPALSRPASLAPRPRRAKPPSCVCSGSSKASPSPQRRVHRSCGRSLCILPTYSTCVAPADSMTAFWAAKPFP